MNFTENWREKAVQRRQVLEEAKKRIEVTKWEIAVAEKFLQQAADRLKQFEAAGEVQDNLLGQQPNQRDTRTSRG